MVPRVGDDETTVVDEDTGRQPQSALRSPAAGLRAFGGEVGLSEHHVGVGVRLQLRGVVPDEDAVVAGVAHDEPFVVEPDATGCVHLVRRRHRIGQCESAGRLGSHPQHR